MKRNLFNLTKLKARNMTFTYNFKELQYADDATMVAHSNQSLRRMIAIQHRVYGRMGLKMNTEKKQFMRLAGEGDDTGAISVGTARLKDVHCFRYL